MIRQSVNLYPEELWPKREPLQLPVVLVGVAAVIVCVVLTAFYVRHVVSTEKQALQALNNQNSEFLTRIEALSQQVAQQQSDPILARQLAVIEDEINQRKRVVKELEGFDEMDHVGFSEYLRALAREVPTGLWLTSVYINRSGEQLRLEGGVADASAVPAYLELLGEEAVFSGQRFEAFQLSRDKSSEPLRFSISTHHREDAS